MAEPSPNAADVKESNIDLAREDFLRKLRQILHLPIWLLNLTGVHPIANSASLSQNVDVSRIRRASILLHGTLFGVFHIVNVARVVALLIAYYWKPSPQKPVHTSILSLSALFSATVFLSETVTMRRFLEPLIKAMTDYHLEFGFLHDMLRRQRFSKACTLIGLLADAICYVIWMCTWSMWYDAVEMMNLFSGNKHNPTVTFSLSCCLCFLGAVVMVMVQGAILFHTLLLWLIMDELDATRKRLTDIIKVCNDKTERRFNRCRNRHQSLCKLVVAFSNLTRPTLLINIIFNMVTVFTFIFTLSDSGVSFGWKIFQICFGIVINVLVILFMTYQWGRIPTVAHSITEAVVEADWGIMSKEMTRKMELLLITSGNQKIAVDIFGLFTINGNTTMMVLGSLVTYGVVVFQFQQDSDVQCACGNVTQT